MDEDLDKLIHRGKFKVLLYDLDVIAEILEGNKTINDDLALTGRVECCDEFAEKILNNLPDESDPPKSVKRYTASALSNMLENLTKQTNKVYPKHFVELIYRLMHRNAPMNKPNEYSIKVLFLNLYAACVSEIDKKSKGISNIELAKAYVFLKGLGSPDNFRKEMKYILQDDVQEHLSHYKIKYCIEELSKYFYLYNNLKGLSYSKRADYLPERTKIIEPEQVFIELRKYIKSLNFGENRPLDR